MVRSEAAEAVATQLDFAEVVREHQALVFSIAYHFLHDRAVAEELAQDVFLKLSKTLPGLESPAHVVHWLRRVTSHRCIDYCRRRKLAPQISLENIPEPSTPASPGDPMLSRRLRQLVASLPEKGRMMVVLRYQEGLEAEEIAAVMGIPSGTVKSQLSRSIAMLREKLNRTLRQS
jgi:RNA polymerase sigma-70 factor (ECF subfamily)